MRNDRQQGITDNEKIIFNKNDRQQGMTIKNDKQQGMADIEK